jgi:hypothetical protein
MAEFKEGDWAAYNWLDDDGNDNWKIGRIVMTNNPLMKEQRLMYFNNDCTDRSGWMPISKGVKRLVNVSVPEVTLYEPHGCLSYSQGYDRCDKQCDRCKDL